MHRDFEAGPDGSPGGSERFAQSELLDSSAAVAAVRTSNLLRSRSERNLFLDDKDGTGAIDPPRILDDRPERSWSRLPPAAIGIKMENFLSFGRYQLFPS